VIGRDTPTRPGFGGVKYKPSLFYWPPHLSRFPSFEAVFDASL